MKQEKFLKAVKTVTKALNNNENLFFTYRTVLAKTFIDCFKSYKEQSELISMPDEEQLDYIANNAASKFLNAWIKGQMAEHLNENMFDDENDAPELNGWAVKDNIGLAAYELLEIIKHNDRKSSAHTVKMIEQFFKKYPKYYDSVKAHVDFGKSYENKTSFIVTNEGVFPKSEEQDYNKNYVEHNRKLDEKLFFELSTMSQYSLVNEYMKSEHLLYHDADIPEALERFSKWIQFSPPSSIRNFFEQNEAQKNDQNPLSELANEQRITIEELSKRNEQLIAETQLQDDTIKQTWNALEESRNQTVDTKILLSEAVNILKNIEHVITPRYSEERYKPFLDKIALYNKTYSKNEGKQNPNKESLTHAYTKEPLNGNRGGLKMERNDYATSVFSESMNAAGPNVTNVACYTSKSGLRLACYKADGVEHMSISHPDRMPTWEEIWTLRDDFGPVSVQMAHVMEHNKRPKENTITLIELFYK